MKNILVLPYVLISQGFQLPGERPRELALEVPNKQKNPNLQVNATRIEILPEIPSYRLSQSRKSLCSCNRNQPSKSGCGQVEKTYSASPGHSQNQACAHFPFCNSTPKAFTYFFYLVLFHYITSKPFVGQSTNERIKNNGY